MKQTQQTLSLQSDFSKLKMSREAAMLPMYIDLAIYDLMADGRKRSVNEVVSALALLGYLRNDVNRRMVSMLHKSKIFVEAKGGKGKVLYELRKGAKRPDFSTSETKTADTVKESEIILRPQHDDVPVSYRKRRTFDISEMTMQNQTTQPHRKTKRTDTAPSSIELNGDITVAELAAKMGVKAGEVIRKLMTMDRDCTLNQMLDLATATAVANGMGYEVQPQQDSTDQWQLIKNALGSGVQDPTNPYPTAPAQSAVERARQDVNDEIARIKAEAGVVQPNDPVRVALWKTMHDLQPYKYTDLCVLLDHIPSGTITYHLRKMVDLNMLTVDRTDKRCHIYQLIEGVPMPEGLPPYEPNVPLAASQQPQLPLNQEPDMQTKTDYTIEPQPQPEVVAQDTDESKPTDAASVGQFKNPNEPEKPTGAALDKLLMSYKPLAPAGDDNAAPDQPKEVPLVEIGGIKVAGQHFSYSEARQLLAELKAEGYGNIHGVIDRRVKKRLTVSWKVTIGLVEVTPHQANDIALTLISELE